MKVLVMGGGGREHALVWKIARSPLVEEIYCAPGNPGIAELAEIVPSRERNLKSCWLSLWIIVSISTVVGPEAAFPGDCRPVREHGLKIFGPRKNAAIIEASKAFSKDLMHKYEVPTAAYGVFTEISAAEDFIDRTGASNRIKADGLAAGKGVIIAQTREEAIERRDGTCCQRECFRQCRIASCHRRIPGTGKLSFFSVITDGKTHCPTCECPGSQSNF